MSDLKQRFWRLVAVLTLTSMGISALASCMTWNAPACAPETKTSGPSYKANGVGILAANAPSSPSLGPSGLYFSPNANIGPLLTQNQFAAVDAGIPDAGYNLVVQAENGQSAYGAITAGGGGATWVMGGAAGTNFTDAASNGAPGPVILGVADAAVFECVSTTSCVPAVTNSLNLGSQTFTLNTVTGESFLSVDDAGANLAGSLLQVTAYGSTPYPMLSFFSGSAPVVGTLGDFNIVDNGGVLTFTNAFNPFISIGENNQYGTGGALQLGTQELQFNPGFFTSPVNSPAYITYPPMSSVTSGAVVGGSISAYAQAGQNTTGNNTAGAGGGMGWQGGDGGVSSGTTVAAKGGSGGPGWVGGGPGGQGSKAGVGGTGGNGYLYGGPGAPGDAGGGGGNDFICSGGGAAGHTTSGASGAIEMIVGSTTCGNGVTGSPSTGTLVEQWGPTPYLTPSDPTIATTGTTTLSAANVIAKLIDLGTVTATGSIVVQWPVVTAWSGYVSINGITLGANTLTFETNGGVACSPIASITNSVNGNEFVWIKVDGGISCGQ